MTLEIAVDLASPQGDYAVWTEYERQPDGSIRVVRSLAVVPNPPQREVTSEEKR